MKYPAWTTNPEMLDTGIREAAFVTTIIPKVEGVAAEIMYCNINRWDHSTFSWGTNGNSDRREVVRRETFATVEEARAAWEALSLPGELLFKGKVYAFYVDKEAEAAYSERLDALGGDGAEIVAKLKAPYANADFIRSQFLCEQ